HELAGPVAGDLEGDAVELLPELREMKGAVRERELHVADAGAAARLDEEVRRPVEEAVEAAHHALEEGRGDGEPEALRLEIDRGGAPEVELGDEPVLPGEILGGRRAEEAAGSALERELELGRAALAAAGLVGHAHVEREVRLLVGDAPDREARQVE